MGQRGPKAKHPALKLLAGNPGGRPAVILTGGRVRRGVPVRPPELTGVAGEVWDTVVVELTGANTLAVVDAGIVAAYALAVADMLWARDTIAGEGRLIEETQTTSKGEVVGMRKKIHPAVKIGHDACNRVHKLAHALGLTPQARDRMEAPDLDGANVPGNRILEIRERIREARS